VDKRASQGILRKYDATTPHRCWVHIQLFHRSYADAAINALATNEQKNELDVTLQRNQVEALWL